MPNFLRTSQSTHVSPPLFNHSFPSPLQSSEQSEAHRAKNKAARERRAQRVAAKKEALLGPEPVEAAPAAPAAKAEKKEKAPKQKK